MPKKTTYVIQASVDHSVSWRNRAAGGMHRIHYRFTRGGKFDSCQWLGKYRTRRGLVDVYRTTTGFGTNQIAWYDWYEA